LASQQPYIKQPVLDPMKPIPQAKPSSMPFFLQGASSVLGAATQAYGMSQQIPKAPTGQYPYGNYTDAFRR
jgi:hypothetical protein